MPQMAPILWLLLFIIFTFTFIMFNILNYFCYFSNMPKKTPLNKTSNNNFTMSWSW